MSSDATQPPPTRAGDLPTMSVDAPVTAPLARPRLAPAEPVKPRIDGYEVHSVAGEGAMGTVWKSTQLGTRRTVALKLMRAHVFASERARLRFEREVEITARLEHPNIARIYDSGVHEGIFYYAMEYIEGIPLDAYIKQKALDPRQTIALFKTVCEAVEHAHLRGVIHRDLKPGNIIVDAEGRPHVLDFGLAKALAEQTRVHEVSLDGDVSGTPAFMSPEQASGHNDVLDTRTDVFSLGVILYRLMCHAPPHEMTGTHQQLMQRIIDEDAKRPRAVCGEVDRELEALLLKALARDREQRYKSAGDLARDLDNYLRHEPLMARVPTTAYFLRKRLWRYRYPVSMAAGVLVALLIVAVVAYVQVVKQRNLAIAAQKLAEARERARTLSDGQKSVSLGDNAAMRNDLTGALAAYKEAYRLLQPLGAQRRAELGLLEIFRQIAPPLVTWRFSLGGVTDAAFLPGDERLALACGDGTVLVFGLAAATGSRVIRAQERTATCVAATDDGRILTGGDDGTIRLWTADGQPLPRVRVGDGWVTRADVSADGRRAAVVVAPSVVDLGGGANQLVLVDLVTGRATRHDLDGPRTRVRLAPDGAVLTTGAAFTLHDADGVQLLSLPRVTAAAFAADGRTIVIATDDRRLRVIDRGGRTLRDLPPLEGRAIAVGLAADGRIAAALDDGTACLFDASGARVRRFARPPGAEPPAHAEVSADATLVVAIAPGGGGSGDAVTVWHTAADPTTPWPAAASAVKRLAVADNVLLAHAGEQLATFDLITARPWRPTDVDGPVRVAAAAGSILATTPGDAITLNDLRTGARTPIPADLVTAAVTALAVAPDGGRIAVAAADGRIVVHQPASGRRQVLLEKDPRFAPRALAFSPDGARLAAAGRGMRAWDLTTGSPLASDNSHTDRINAIAFSPDGSTLVSGSGAEPVPVLGNDYTVRTWKMTDQPARVLGQHGAQVNALAFFPSLDPAASTWLVTGSSDGTVRVWDPDTREMIRSLPNGRPVLAVAVSPDGRKLFAGDDAGAIRLWDLDRPGRQLDLQQQVAAITSDAQRCRPEDLLVLARWHALLGRFDWAAAVPVDAPEEEKRAWQAMTQDKPQ